jgi:hypothetical protein
MSSINTTANSDYEGPDFMEESARNSLQANTNLTVGTSVGNSASTEGSRSSNTPNSFTFSIRPKRDSADRDSLKVPLHGDSIALIKSRSEVLEKKIEGYLSEHRDEDKILYAMGDHDIECQTIEWFITLLCKANPEEGLVDLRLNQMVQIANLIYEFKCNVKPFEPLWYGFKDRFQASNSHHIRQIGLATRVATAASNTNVASPFVNDLSGPDLSRMAHYQGNYRGDVSDSNTRRPRSLTHSSQVEYLDRGQYFQYLILSVVFGDEEVFKSCFEEALLREMDLHHSHPETFKRCCVPELKGARDRLLKNAIKYCQESWTNLENHTSKDVSKGFKKLESWLTKNHASVLRFLRGVTPDYRSVHGLVLDLTTNLAPSSNAIQSTRASASNNRLSSTGRGGILEDVDWQLLWQRLGRGNKAEDVALTFIKDLKPNVEIVPRRKMWTRLHAEYQKLQKHFTERTHQLEEDLDNDEPSINHNDSG